MERRNENDRNIRGLVKRARYFSKLTSKPLKLKKTKLPQRSKPDLIPLSPKARAVAAAERRLNKEKKSLKNPFSAITGTNIDIKYSFSVVWNSLGNVLTWLLQPAQLGPTVFILLGYLFKENSLGINYWIRVLLVGLLSFGIILFIAFLYAVEEKYVIVQEKTKDDSNYWLTEEDIMEVHHSLPFYFSRPEIDSAMWINEVIEMLWPYVEDDIKRNITYFLGGSLTFNHFPVVGPSNPFTDFRIVKLSLGKKPPVITGIHFWKRGVRPKEIMLDVALIYNADVDVMIKGFYTINAGLQMVSVKALVRIIVGPLHRIKPAVSALLFTLLEVPTIEWRFVGFIRFLNGIWIQRLVAKVVYALFGTPNKFMIRLMKEVPISNILLKEPVGVITVDILDAINLPRSEKVNFCSTGKVSAFCTVTVEGEEKSTQVISKNDHPEWRKSFTFLYRGQTGTKIEMSILDDDASSSYAQEIAIYQVPLEKFKYNNEWNGREMSGSLRDPNNRRQLTKGKTKIGFRISYFELTTQIQKLATPSTAENINMPVAILTVVIHYATGLETVPKQYQTPELRSMVRVTVGNQIEVTRIQEKTGYPVYEQPLHFMLINPQLEDLHVEVIDMYYVQEKKYFFLIGKKHKNDQHSDWVKLSEDGVLIGWISIPIRNTVTAPEMKTKQLYQLDGYVENGFIKIATAMRITQYPKVVLENHKKQRILFPDDRFVFSERKKKEDKKEEKKDA